MLLKPHVAVDLSCKYWVTNVVITQYLQLDQLQHVA